MEPRNLLHEERGVLSSIEAINTVRLPAEALRSLAQVLNQRDSLDEHERKGRGHRVGQRFSIDPPKELSMHLQSDAFARNAYLVFARDLSAQGMSLLHGVFVAPDTRCRLTIRTLDKEPMQLPGLIRRCRLVGGRVHELGVKFDQPIDPRTFLDLCQDEEGEAKAQEKSTLDLSAVSALATSIAAACDDKKTPKEILALIDQARGMVLKAARRGGGVKPIEAGVVGRGWGARLFGWRRRFRAFWASRFAVVLQGLTAFAPGYQLAVLRTEDGSRDRTGDGAFASSSRRGGDGNSSTRATRR
jgi:hypothetical protein